MKSKFLICYVQRCSPKMKVATSEEAAMKFVKDFLEKHEGNTEDNWIDFMVETVSEVRMFDYKIGGFSD